MVCNLYTVKLIQSLSKVATLTFKYYDMVGSRMDIFTNFRSVDVVTCVSVFYRLSVHTQASGVRLEKV